MTFSKLICCLLLLFINFDYAQAGSNLGGLNPPITLNISAYASNSNLTNNSETNIFFKIENRQEQYNNNRPEIQLKGNVSKYLFIQDNGSNRYEPIDMPKYKGYLQVTEHKFWNIWCSSLSPKEHITFGIFKVRATNPKQIDKYTQDKCIYIDDSSPWFPYNKLNESNIEFIRMWINDTEKNGLIKPESKYLPGFNNSSTEKVPASADSDALMELTEGLYKYTVIMTYFTIFSAFITAWIYVDHQFKPD